jgi:hypothetical protein
MRGLFAEINGILHTTLRTAVLGLAAAVLSVGLFVEGAVADGVPTTPSPAPSATTTWGGIGWGIGLAADFDIGGARVANATLANGIVRITDTSSNVGVGFVLEAHYFLRDYEYSFANAAKQWICSIYCNVDVAVGPFVAIEVGGGSSATPAAGDPITGYALGFMLGLHHPDPSNPKASPTSSWNFGVGLRVDPKAQVLGDGVVANQPLPAGETAIRYKTEPREGIMLLSSFSF